MKLRWIGATLLLAACQPVPPVPVETPMPMISTSPSAPPEAPVTPVPPFDGLQGLWILGTDEEPAAGVVPNCEMSDPFFVTLEQSGDELVFKRLRRCGALERERAVGTLVDNRVSFKGLGDPLAPDAPRVNYELTFNPTTMHFTGTRDGARVWLARHYGFCTAWVKAPCATLVRGRVEDANGRPIPHATVRVRSLNPSSPFASRVETPNGTYQVSDVPAGVTIEISVMVADEVLSSRTAELTYIDESVTLPINVVDFVDLTPPP